MDKMVIHDVSYLQYLEDGMFTEQLKAAWEAFT